MQFYCIINKNHSILYVMGWFALTNINCSCNCKYQIDGKCHLDDVKSQKISPSKECIYFSPKWNKGDGAFVSNLKQEGHTSQISS